jgi:hypothetical protein
MKGRKYKLAQSVNIKYEMYPRFAAFALSARIAG